MQDIAIPTSSCTFEDMSYIVEMPTEMKSQSLDINKLQLYKILVVPFDQGFLKLSLVLVELGN